MVDSLVPSLLDYLVMDHKRIRSLFTELRDECDRDRIDEETCFNLFRTLKALVIAHAKAEEYTLYAIFDEPKSERNKDLEHYSLEGYEEHDIIDMILKEMGQAEEISARWRAQLTVLIELLEHHLDEEEREFFPKVRRLIDAEDLEELALAYVQERDLIFTKRTAVKPPVTLVHTLQ